MALPVAAVGVGLSAYGMYMQGQTAAMSASLAKGADYYEAEQYEKQGQQQAEYLQRRSTRTEGANLASGAASGVDVTTGSPAMAILDQVTQDQKSIAITLSNAQHKALAARMAGDQGVLLGGQREEAANIGAAAGILSGGARLYGMTQRGNSTGGNQYAGPDNFDYIG